MSELKPCPFCGGTSQEFICDRDQGTKWGFVGCGCGARSPDVRTQYDCGEKAHWHDDAAKEWNTRASELISIDEAIAAVRSLPYDDAVNYIMKHKAIKALQQLRDK